VGPLTRIKAHFLGQMYPSPGLASALAGIIIEAVMIPAYLHGVNNSRTVKFCLME